MNNFSETQILSLQRGKHSTYQMCRLVCSDPRQPIEEKQCAYKIGNIALDGRENWNVNIVDLGGWSAHTRRGAKNARRVVILGQLQLNRQHGQTNRPLNSNDQSFDHMTLAIRTSLLKPFCDVFASRTTIFSLHHLLEMTFSSFSRQ